MSIKARLSVDNVTLYQGDCLEIIPQLKSGIAAVITDPPYMIASMSLGNINSKTGTWADMMNGSMWYSAWYKAIFDKLRDDGSLWTFCNWRSIPVVMRAALDAGLPVTSVLVWDKQKLGPGGMTGLRPTYELVVVMGKVGFTIKNRAIGDIWREPSLITKPSGHPAEKPVQLYRRILSVLELQKDAVVVDPFAGSGTLADAARSMNYECILIESDNKWCEVIEKRLSQKMMLSDASIE